MSLATILPTAIGLSADAFAVAIARGTASRDRRLRAGLRVGALFGGMEGLMCLIGWALAFSFASTVRSLDHWIALVLLAAIGAHMIHEGLSGEDEAASEAAAPARRSPLAWLAAAMGTSVDAAAVGIAFAFSGASIWLAAPIIALTSGAISTFGYMAGPALGQRFGKRAEIAGGLVLIAIGVMIFLEHTLGNG